MNKFLGTSGGDVNLSNGSTVLFGSTIGAENLSASMPLKTNSLKQLVSTNLEISDINSLQSTLDNLISDEIVLSTGLISGGIISIGSPASTFNITAGTGTVIVTNPLVDDTITKINVSWNAFTNVPVTNIGTQTVTFIAIDQTGAIVQSNSRLSTSQMRTLFSIGVLSHPNLTTISTATPDVQYIANPMSSLRDFASAVGLLSTSGNGVEPFASLRFKKNAGTVFDLSGNYAVGGNLDPNTVLLPEVDTSVAGTFRYLLKDSSISPALQDITPNILDDGTAYPATTYANNRWGNQRIYVFTSGTVFLAPAQFDYGSLSAAVDAINTEAYVEHVNFADNSVLVGVITIKGNTTVMTNTADCLFKNVLKFGAVTGSIATSNLQTSYDNSTPPQIVTDATRGAMVIKRGSTLDTDDVFAIQNGASSVVLDITGEGNVECTNIRTTSTEIHLASNAGVTNQGTDAIAIGNVAGNTNQGVEAVAIGSGAGFSGQGGDAIGIGTNCASTDQGASSIAIGVDAGQTTQGQQSIAMGYFSGKTTQGPSSVAVGSNAGETSQQTNSVAIGTLCGNFTQGTGCVAMGNTAGQTSQGIYSVAIGTSAGNSGQQSRCVAIGNLCGVTTQEINSVAIGTTAGQTSQGQSSVSIGNNAGNNTQGVFSVAIGLNAGETTQGQSSVAIGNSAGNFDQDLSAVAIGDSAGNSNQGRETVAIGASSGRNTQGDSAVAIGTQAGDSTQSQRAVAIGIIAGRSVQGSDAVAIGNGAGQTNQGIDSVSIGNRAGDVTQGTLSVAIGKNAGQTTQSANSVAIGNTAGQTSQSTNSVAIGNTAGNSGQLASAVAIGHNSGNSGQGIGAVAIGVSSGNLTQGESSVAVGDQSGVSLQGDHCVAIGDKAGNANQGDYCVAIGHLAGSSNQTTNSIVLNSSSVALQASNSGFFVKPITTLASGTGKHSLVYDSTTGEIFYLTATLP